MTLPSRPARPQGLGRRTLLAAVAAALASTAGPASALGCSVSFLCFFPANDATLNERSERIVAQAIRSRLALQQGRSLCGTAIDPVPPDNLPLLEVVGHAWAEGSSTRMTLLSSQRARAVADRLRAAGIEEDQIRITPVADTRPLLQAPRQQPQPENRRVEIIFRSRE